MKITDTKIINALKAGKRITSNGMPSHCFLQADVDCGGIAEYNNKRGRCYNVHI